MNDMKPVRVRIDLPFGPRRILYVRGEHLARGALRELLFLRAQKNPPKWIFDSKSVKTWLLDHLRESVDSHPRLEFWLNFKHNLLFPMVEERNLTLSEDDRAEGVSDVIERWAVFKHEAWRSRQGRIVGRISGVTLQSRAQERERRSFGGECKCGKKGMECLGMDEDAGATIYYCSTCGRAVLDKWGDGQVEWRDPADRRRRMNLPKGEVVLLTFRYHIDLHQCGADTYAYDNEQAAKDRVVAWAREYWDDSPGTDPAPTNDDEAVERYFKESGESYEIINHVRVGSKA